MKQISVVLLFFFSSLTFGQLKTYSFEEVDVLQKSDPKPVFIFIHTDWCKVCHLMKNTTLKNKRIIKKLNNDFYTIMFNGESKEDIIFHNQKYVYKPSGPTTGTHELAYEIGMLDGQLAFPTTCILDKNYDIVFQFNMSLSKNELMMILNKTD
ncbi:thioredoxin family protein [Urechidicola vernalis]|uniref:Thioredoxin family protein n=1 Tax=Urechidicola vernalis TaxID=3075600 RepID=A0ABU2YB18_9FLAO|nr:thioredoxin family protein [Urechidicola sp. P050]MDT0554248.1 thioredoxin family protein [Urechidicola sp. P050]